MSKNNNSQNNSETQKKHSNWWKWLLGTCLIFFLLVIFGIAGCTYLGKKAVKNVGEEVREYTESEEFKELQEISESAKPLSEKNLVIYPSTDYVEIGEAKWHIESSEFLGKTLNKEISISPENTENLTASQGNEYLRITFEITSNSTETQTISAPSLTDSDWREYFPTTNTLPWIPESSNVFIITTLEPNTPTTYTAIYEIPDSASGLKAVISDFKLIAPEQALIQIKK